MSWRDCPKPRWAKERFDIDLNVLASHERQEWNILPACYEAPVGGKDRRRRIEELKEEKRSRGE